MIGRRGVLLTAAAAALARPAAAALPVPPGAALSFRLVRFGYEIGRHDLTFDRQDNLLTVQVAVHVVVTVFSYPVFQYSQKVVETWADGTLVGLIGTTDRNGERLWMKATCTRNGLEVVGSKTQRYLAPAEAIGTTYWNRRMLDGPMISLEDGTLLHPDVAVRPPESIRLACGTTIPAEHYSLSGPFDADVWYDQTSTWAGLAFPVPDGSHVRYERL